MTPRHAHDVAALVARTWPGSPVDLGVWAEVLEPLERDAAIGAVRRLRERAPRVPSIAEYLAEYRGLVAAAAPPPRVPCSTCGGDGWRSVQRFRGQHPYAALVPCSCSAGDQHRPAYTAALEFNDAQIGALGYQVPILTPEPTAPRRVGTPPPPRRERLI